MSNKQLSFPWEIDREATRKAVEEHLETARIYKQVGFMRREMKTAPSYEPRFHGATNAISKPAEDIGTWNVDTDERMKETQERVDRAVGRLGRLERQIIQQRYLEDDEVFDYNVFSDLHLSERKYYRVKSNAIYKLAFALRLEVYAEEEESG